MISALNYQSLIARHERFPNYFRLKVKTRTKRKCVHSNHDIFSGYQLLKVIDLRFFGVSKKLKDVFKK